MSLQAACRRQAGCRAATWLLVVLAVIAGLAYTRPAWSQLLPEPQAADAQAAPTPAEIDDLVATLEDPEARAALVAQLRLLRQAQATAADAEPEGASLLDALSAQVERISGALVSAGEALVAVPAQFGAAFDSLSRPVVRERLLESIVKLALVLGPAWLVQWLLSRLFARPWEAGEQRGIRGFWPRLSHVVARFVLRLVTILAFAATAYSLLAAFELRPVPLLIALGVINANIAASVLLVLARTFLSPTVPSLRLLPLSNESANYAMVWVWRLVVVGVYGYFMIETLAALRSPPPLTGAVARVIGLIVAALGVVLVLQNRAAVAAWLRGGREAGGLGRVRRGLAEIWHLLAITAIVLVYLVWALGIEGGFAFLARALLLSALVLAGARVLSGLLRRGSRRLFALSHEMREQFPGLEARANRYLPVLENLLLVVVYVLVVLVLLQVWGVPTLEWLSSESGRQVVGTVVKIGVILVVAVIASELVSSLIARYLTRKSRIGEPLARSARIRTLLPMVRNAFRIVLGILVFLIVLSEIGIDIAPLLAGAGVVGLAIGFGAQSLVSDVITGIFILAEDTIAVGDVVEVAGHSGVVEGMSVRSIRLRDQAGTVHTVRFSAVDTVKNLTKDFSFAVFDIAVAYREDTDEVVAIMREVAASLQTDETLGPDILEPMEILGVDQLAESAVIIKARIMTRPIKQWNVMREFNRRLKQAFDARGIEIPFPYRTLVFGTGKDGAAAPARVKVEAAPVPEPAPAPTSEPHGVQPAGG